MRLRHAPAIWQDFPELAAAAISVGSVRVDSEVEAVVAARLPGLLARADALLEGTTESALPRVQAWRRVFASLGVKPTQYRCASEALLRRYRRDGVLPRVHPLVDLCNAVSMAYAIPVAALDLDRIDGDITVRHARGDERYDTFAGDIETPAPGEVVYADDAGRAHARRWTNRQSGHSAVSAATARALIVAEAVHPGAADDVAALVAELGGHIAEVWGREPVTAQLTAARPEFEAGG